MRMWHDELVRRHAGAMHVDTIRSHQKAADGTIREYRSQLLRHSFRDEQGRPRKETLANLTALPDAALEAVRKVLRGEAVVSADEAFEVQRSVPHGDAAAAHVMASALGLRDLLGPACRERDIAYALILSRAIRPESKLSTLGWWHIRHYLDQRVRSHVLICMLAAYLTWHLRAALADLTFTDQHIPEPADPV